MRDMAECPVCGSECNLFYQNENNEIVGCEQCVHEIDAWEYSQEQKYSAMMDRAYDEDLERRLGFR